MTWHIAAAAFAACHDSGTAPEDERTPRKALTGAGKTRRRYLPCELARAFCATLVRGERRLRQGRNFSISCAYTYRHPMCLMAKRGCGHIMWGRRAFWLPACLSLHTRCSPPSSSMQLFAISLGALGGKYL